MPPVEPPEEIRAELVASVLEVSATAGVRVAGGQAIVLLESMKMEIPVVSETGGTVVSVAVAVGDVVQSGDLIAVVDAEEAPE
ncbi:acetyl-CoA carboxylase biotin carboxyl carrier protein subunit [Pseudonocardia sulfidoxydans NBRC 16205]|uniref:Acetyl-CoA carboxylase biotin carboxyl carrier protein subunit n=1 Tax=Pseudonocardia sulfidoxydans NBRC 16205 TaxID=1223511 RepID=A0A511DKM1_9PSEU|nr:acetyl-CoA carboxylase biotin carboxyl carrier protein subunit [Pseudonocardia sulfidoxydans NBRC 16205]